jgi:hypothetical protein
MAKRCQRTPADILQLIRRLSPAGREALWELLYEEYDLLGDYVLLHDNDMKRTLAELGSVYSEIVQHKNKLILHRKGPQAKHDRVEERHQEIDKAIEVGITDPDAILKLLRENHPELVRKGKGFIKPEIMMRQYRGCRKAGE